MKGAKKLSVCKHCGAEIAASAKTCPHCGGKNKKPFYKKPLFWIIAVLIVIGIASQHNSDDPVPATNTADNVQKPSVTEQAETQSAKDEMPAPAEQPANDDSVPPEKGPEQSKEPKKSAEEAYQEILDAYSAKLQDATPGLIEEYKAEAANNTAGLDGLAKISNEKIEKLAMINNEGVQKMADIMFTMGSGSYEEYESWAGKLMDVYMDEAGKITDAYLNSAT